MAHFKIYKVISLEQYRRLFEQSPGTSSNLTSAAASTFATPVSTLPQAAGLTFQPSAEPPNYDLHSDQNSFLGGARTTQQQDESPEASALLLGIPDSQKSKARRLINFIINQRSTAQPSSSLTWERNGEISYLGMTVPKSNIIDLLSAATSQSKIRKLSLPGMQLFIKYLKDVNVPQYYLGSEYLKTLSQYETFDFKEIEQHCKNWLSYEKFILNNK